MSLNVKMMCLLPEVNNKVVRFPEDSSAAVQGHCDLLSVHLVELHLDAVDAGCDGRHPSSQNTLLC